MKTIFQRGYSQSYQLAYHLAKLIGQKPLRICIKSKNTTSQLLLDKYQREKNVLNTFKPNKNLNLNKIDYIILIDDILTTGATIQEVSKCIKKAYPNLKIWGLVVGRYA